jgi:hypothetical protein
MNSSGFGRKPSFQQNQQSPIIQEQQHQQATARSNLQQQQQQQQQQSSSNFESEKYSGALWEFFYRQLVFSRQNPDLANRMMKFWSLAGHDESSLRSFVAKHRPDRPELLRLLLVSELVKAPATGYPVGVSVDNLLDQTASFFQSEIGKNVEETEESRMASLEPLQVTIFNILTFLKQTQI